MAKSSVEIKRKLREIKRLEINLRFHGDANEAEGNLVWDEFFSLRSGQNSSSKYNLKTLEKMNRDEFKEVLDEYFYFVYFRNYQERGLSFVNLYDPNLLGLLGLPLSATESEIKSKFRELAKKYHPDMGGDAEKFMELMDIYNQLTDLNP